MKKQHKIMNRYADIKKRKTKVDWIRPKGVEYYASNKYPEVKKMVTDIWVLTEWGDRLDLLANQFYGDTSLWWVIAVANPEKIEKGSLLPEPGIQIRIPADPSIVVNNYTAKNLTTSFDVGQ